MMSAGIPTNLVSPIRAGEPVDGLPVITDREQVIVWLTHERPAEPHPRT